MLGIFSHFLTFTAALIEEAAQTLHLPYEQTTRWSRVYARTTSLASVDCVSQHCGDCTHCSITGDKRARIADLSDCGPGSAKYYRLRIFRTNRGYFLQL